jgi:putative membrane protein
MINVLVNIGVAVTALLHLWFFILEFFFWTKPLGLKTFRINQERANQSASLAANQGIYNGFLSAGLVWGLLSGNPDESFHVKIFFLSCVLIAGIYAGLTVSRRILFVQALPAVITLILLYYSI